MKNIQIGFIHIRHAASIIKIDNKEILIDPMLSAKESFPPVKLAVNKLKNPRTDLPFNSDSIIKNIDYLLLTHLHFDHFDKKAIEILSKKTSVLCSKTDVKRLNDLGFSLTCPIEKEYEIDGIKITQYPAIHGKGLLKYLMGKGSSYLIDYKGFKIFLTGDCLLTSSLKNNLIKTEPDIVIANAGAAKFKFGKPITMSIKEIQEISKILENSKIFVIHLDALNHCSETRDYCKEQIRDYSNIYIPNDGEEIKIK
jgi:L-ascorbate metabolism protein UlaG (beta-lactamase superfamily)